jgi:hypothetical protein
MSGTGGSSSNIGAAYAGLPVAMSQVLMPTGRMQGHWYRFFQTLWQKNFAGIPNDITMGTLQLQANHNAAQTAIAQDTANTAGTSAGAANAAVAAETERSIAAENNLQGQITVLATHLGQLQVGGVGAAPTGVPVAGLNVTIAGVNYVIPLYA